MGFGMRKEVYMRKPKKVHAHIKELYGQELEHSRSKTKEARLIEVQPLTQEQRGDIKKRIKRRLVQERQTKIKVAFISIFLTVVFLAALVWFTRYVVGF